MIGLGTLVRAQKSRSDSNGPPSALARRIERIAVSLIPRRRRSPTRMSPFSTVKRSSLRLTHGGSILLPSRLASSATVRGG